MGSRLVWVAAGVCLLAGCGKRLSTVVAEHKAEFAAMDAKIAQAKALAAGVPERGTRAFPRCKPSKDYVFSSGLNSEENTIDVLSDGMIAWDAGPLALALRFRKEHEGEGRFSGPKATPYDEKRLDVLKRLKHLVVLRDHKASTEHHVTADVFVVDLASGKITCAFGFDGGEGGYGSAGTVVGKEVRINKRTGQKVGERDVVQGASAGTSGAVEARGRLRSRSRATSGSS
ncbi:MAG TPA: hypothetical protein PLR99_16060 [Polyangiaceae bacterium]|nr:hypothetical protein [Polyangiaceae bacterium]